MDINAIQEFLKSHMPQKEYAHATSVLGICCSLEKNAPLCLQIAALCHDIDRSYGDWKVNTKQVTSSEYEYAKGVHTATSVVVLMQSGLITDAKLLHDVVYLMIRHEHGPLTTDSCIDWYTSKFDLSPYAKILWYADKLSFFKDGLELYALRGEEILRKKIEFSLKDLPRDLQEQCVAYTPQKYRELAQSCLD
jgi:HD superfamily phosphohydrolase YqeK